MVSSLRFRKSACRVVWILYQAVPHSAHEVDFRAACASLVDGDYGDARMAIDQTLQSGMTGDFVDVVAGRIYAGVPGLHEQALTCLNRVSDNDPALSLIARREAGIRHSRIGSVVTAEMYFRKALSIYEHDQETCREYSNLLNRQGRTWEALPFVHRLFRQGVRKKTQVMKSAAIDGTFSVDKAYIQRCRQQCPDDPIILLVEARRDLLKNRIPEARDHLEEVLAVHPELIEAQVRYGRVVLQTDTIEFLRWHDEHAESLESHPEVWCLRGLFAERNQKLTAATRFYIEAVRRYPDHQEANARLAQLLGQHGHTELAENLGRRARDIAQMVYLSSELAGKPKPKMMKEAAEIMLRNGRYWEAAGWCETYEAFRPLDPWNLEFLNRVRPFLVNSETADTASPDIVPRELNDEFPLLPLPRPESVSIAESDAKPSSRATHVSFKDIAEPLGLGFNYDNGGSEPGALEHMLQSTGGGVGVLDFDLDSWPDLYFAQSKEWFSKGESRAFPDQLYRNIRGQSAQLCEPFVIPEDVDFSQGVACGDCNDDGFPDIFVANVGGNRLFVNNGDGTFTDQTPAAWNNQQVWSLSAAFADLDRDGFSDLYVVNYLVLREVIERLCRRSGRPMGCAPTMFQAEQDRLYQNDGAGDFLNVTDTSGIITEDGKGLGVVIADFDNAGGLELFVGNDTTGNFLFRRDASNQSLSFTESAVIQGVAFDEGGNAQSCMGIGVDDADGNGLLDIFVTNFYADANTMYLQTAPNLFLDATRECELRDPGYDMLGFGCQFLDADLDGWRDLVVTNGHVDKSFATGGAPDVMPPQFFHNKGAAAYQELFAESLGPYFQDEALGRTLVVLDWDRDGLEDFCVSHLDRPVSMLRNTSLVRGKPLQIRLVGTLSERIPVGTRVTVTLKSGRTLSRQLTGGGGYEGTNEPVLTFGIPTDEIAVRIRVTWPAGDSVEFEGIPQVRRLALVEGRSVIFSQP